MSHAQSNRPRKFASSLAIAGLTTGLATVAVATGTASAEPIESGNICWGVKESFRDHMKKPLANGSITASGKAEYNGTEFQFPITSGDTEKKISTTGGAHFKAYGGLMNINLFDPALTMTDEDSAVLTAYTDEGKSSQVNLATVEFSAPVAAEGNSIGTVALTSEGAPLFRSYKAGEQMDDLTIAQGDCATNADDEAEKTDDDAQTADPNGPQNPAIHPTDEADAADDKTCVAVESAEVSWGVKESFRSYIKGKIANGAWELDGVEEKDGSFSFTGGEGSINIDEKSGTVEATGTVTFTGHGDKLRLEISNPKVQFDGDTGTLVATVNSNDPEGTPHEYGEIAVATLKLDDLNVTDGEISGTAATSLTEQGSKAFADFYKANDELDPITFSATLSGDTECAVPIPDGEPNGIPNTNGEPNNDTNDAEANGKNGDKDGKKANNESTSSEKSSSKGDGTSSKESKGSRGATAKLASTGGDAADSTDFGTESDAANVEVDNQASKASNTGATPSQFGAIAAALFAVAAGCVYVSINGVRLRRR